MKVFLNVNFKLRSDAPRAKAAAPFSKHSFFHNLKTKIPLIRFQRASALAQAFLTVNVLTVKSAERKDNHVFLRLRQPYCTLHSTKLRSDAVLFVHIDK